MMQKERHQLKLMFWVALSTCSLVWSFPSGAPDSSCTSLKPSHTDPGDIGPPPLEFVLSKPEYMPGDTIQVQLRRTDSLPFKGFILQARRASTGTDQEEKIGAFQNLGSGAKYNCLSSCVSGSECSITHDDNTEKSEVTVDWVAPAEPKGDVVFRTSIVECYEPSVCSVYWHNIPSQVVTGPPEQGVTSSTGGPGQTVTPLPAIDLSDCGISKGCFRSPADCTGSQDCTHLVTWISRGDEIDFELSITLSGGNFEWAAVAFSTDERMGEDSVIDCLYDEATNNVIVQSSWNIPEMKANEVLTDPGLGLADSTLEGSYVDGQALQCTFTRLTSLNGKGLRNDDKIFDLNEPFYIFIGKGSVSSGVKNQHSGVRISPEMVTLSSTEYVNIGGSIPKFPLVVTHGSLMIIAWIVLVSVGVMLPRYFKNMWKDRMILDKALWFQIHRSLMSLAFLLTTVAFIVIFVEVGGYASHLTDADAAHPILGIIVMVLVIVNPIMAVFRPNPQDSKRPVFNVAHFIVGTSAHILGGVTMFLGTRLPKAGMSEWTQWIVVTFAIWHCMLELAMTSHQNIMKRKGLVTPTPSSQDLKSMNSTNGFQNQLSTSSSASKELEQLQIDMFSQKRKMPKFETVMILVHFLVLLSLSIALIVDLIV